LIFLESAKIQKNLKRAVNILNLLRQKYLEGKNISLYIKERKDLFDSQNISQSDAIALSYDLQAGTYLEEYLQKKSIFKNRNGFIVDAINEVNIFKDLQNRNLPITICDMGTGEATNFQEIIEQSKFNYDVDLDSYAMDLSLSRLSVAKKFIESRKTKIIPPKLFLGNLTSIPLLENSINIICTSGAIESNRGLEAQIVDEITRVCSHYLVIVEPIYETASEQQRARMDKYNYITKLKTVIENHSQLDLIKEIIFPLELCINPLNRVSLLIARKKTSKNTTIYSSEEKYACPIGRDKLSNYENYLLSKSGACYPIIDDIPILLAKNMIPFYHKLQIEEK